MALIPNQHSLVTFWHWINHHWLITLLTIASVGLIVATILRFFTSTTTTNIQGGQAWNNITPGVSRIQDLQALGEPQAVQETGVGRKFSFTSNYPAIPNIVLTNPEGVVQLIKEQVVYNEKNTVDAFTAQYGDPSMTLFAPEFDQHVQAFVFLDRGLVLIADQDSKIIEEKWYFTPTDQENFLNTWGVSLSAETPPPERFGEQ